MTSAGTPWGEPRRDALVEVKQCSNCGRFVPTSDSHFPCNAATGDEKWRAARAFIEELRAQAAAQGATTQEQCALYLDMLASNHPHLAEAYRHAAHNLRAQTAETLALLIPPSRTP